MLELALPFWGCFTGSVLHPTGIGCDVNLTTGALGSRNSSRLHFFIRCGGAFDLERAAILRHRVRIDPKLLADGVGA